MITICMRAFFHACLCQIKMWIIRPDKMRRNFTKTHIPTKLPMKTDKNTNLQSDAGLFTTIQRRCLHCIQRTCPLLSQQDGDNLQWPGLETEHHRHRTVAGKFHSPFRGVISSATENKRPNWIRSRAVRKQTHWCFAGAEPAPCLNVPDRDSAQQHYSGTNKRASKLSCHSFFLFPLDTDAATFLQTGFQERPRRALWCGMRENGWCNLSVNFQWFRSNLSGGVRHLIIGLLKNIHSCSLHEWLSSRSFKCNAEFCAAASLKWSD